MSDRITDRDLDGVVALINRTFGESEAAYTRDAEGFHANVGAFTLSHAYGGVELHRISNASGGVSTPLGSTGHVPKRELYGLMHAFLRGIEAWNAHLDGTDR